MTVSSRTPDRDTSGSKHITTAEPLIASVRAYLANEPTPPSKTIVPPLNLPDTPPTCEADISASTIQTEVLRLDVAPKDKVQLEINSNGKQLQSCEQQPGNNNGSVAMPSQAERMQRQPLLARAVKPREEPLPNTSDESDPDRDNGSSPQRPNADFTIEIPQAVGREDRFPKEIIKTLLSFLFLFGSVCINMLSLSLVHERLPDRNTTPPLDDIFLNNIPAREWGLTVSEVLIMTSTTTATAVIIFHKHRFIVSRRVFFVVGLLYLYRSITMYVTVLPISSRTYYCSPKSNNTTPLLIIQRVFYLISGFGLSINGKQNYCGDSIYSGHTMILVMSYLVIAEYSPKKFWPVYWAAWLAALVGVIFVLLAHSHYTVDVVIAYYISTRLFWTYHSLLRFPRSPSGTLMLQREWWYPIFSYFEANVRGPVPRRYNWPLPWPRTKLFSRLS